MAFLSDGPRAQLRNLVAFGLLGLFNNISYVIMLAGANSISAAAVGLVYLAAVGPAIAVKASSPYWFHATGYRPRILASAALMAASFCLVALSTSRGPQLLGVALASLQGGLGEASCLALSARYGPDRAPLTFWSSGTGLAGVAGYAWVASLHVWAGLSFRATLLAANGMAAGWLATYFLLLQPPLAAPEPVPDTSDDECEGGAGEAIGADPERRPLRPLRPLRPAADGALASVVRGAMPRLGSRPSFAGDGEKAAAGSVPPRTTAAMSIVDQRPPLPSGAAAVSLAPGAATARERLRLTLSLWPYTVPLFTVYFAEYSMQSGAWTAIGFPVTDASARHAFYVYANWCYQGGVFVSRSSGMAWQPGLRVLWAMPALQCAILAFFLHDAVAHWWYGWSLLLPCFLTGLLGGAVYVNAFGLLSRGVPPGQREFSMAAASVADSLGIACADVAGVMIQGCLFKANGLPGADFTC